MSLAGSDGWRQPFHSSFEVGNGAPAGSDMAVPAGMTAPEEEQMRRELHSLNVGKDVVIWAVVS
jgi:hypothetical protein